MYGVFTFRISFRVVYFLTFNCIGCIKLLNILLFSHMEEWLRNLFNIEYKLNLSNQKIKMFIDCGCVNVGENARSWNVKAVQK